MRVPGRADFAYGNTRLHARRGELLRDADYQRLLGDGLDGLLAGLDGTPYGHVVEAAGGGDPLRRLHGAISAHLCRSLEEMRSFYAERARRLVDLLLSRFDVHNVVTVLRAQAGEQDRSGDALSALVRVGWLVEPVAGETLRQNELAGAVDLLARSMPDREQADALRAGFAEYERTEDLAALERTVVTDHVLRTTAALEAAGPDARTLLGVVRREIDEHNLLVALRLQDALASGAETEPPPSATRLPGGSIPTAAFEVALRAPAPTAVVRDLRRLGHGTWLAPLRRWAASGDLPALERELERRRIADESALFVGDPLAIDVPIAFTAAKQTEARNLRLLGEAGARGIDPETVRRELVWPEARS
jgi:V/A-type H+/Na+-transporting ATPase subunit C